MAGAVTSAGTSLGSSLPARRVLEGEICGPAECSVPGRSFLAIEITVRCLPVVVIDADYVGMGDRQS